MSAKTPKTIHASGTLPQHGFIRQKNLIPDIIPISGAQLWRWVRDGKFPHPLKLSPRVTAWDVQSVRSWIEAQHKEGAI